MERAYTRQQLIRAVHEAGTAFRSGASARPLALALAALEQVDAATAAELAEVYRSGPWPGAVVAMRCPSGERWVV